MKADYINRDESLRPAVDFRFLRREGIDLLEQLSGHTWTDYNEHDPGVTILEQLCYALTDLGYRAGYDIRDILSNSPATYNELSDTFFPAYKIFNSRAVTVNDFRKILLDYFHSEIKNVWVIPENDFDHYAMSGRYKVYVQPHNELYYQADEHKDDLKEDIIAFLNNNRNLCEHFARVEILKSQEIDIDAEIEVDANVNQDKLVADIYYNLDQLLSPAVAFHSLYQLIDEKYPIDEIFEGPLLLNGFIKDENLKPYNRRIYVSQMVKTILQVKGVKSVRRFSLVVNGKAYNNELLLDELFVPLLKISEKEGEQGKLSLKLFKSGLPVRQNVNAIYKHFEAIKLSAKRVYKFNAQTEKFLDPLPGYNRHIEEYQTIQQQFPIAYGIGEYGTASDAPPLRQAQARQLKGYLSHFEQIMADYLAQLASVNKLFSLAEDLGQTYFTQPLNKVYAVDDTFNRRLREKKIFDDEGYERSLAFVSDQFDNYLERRNRILDHLLARFGEQFSEDIYNKLQYYFTRKEVLSLLIRSKLGFLKNIANLGAEKARGFNYTKGINNAFNASGFEKAIATKLAIDPFYSASLFTAFDRSGISLVRSYRKLESDAALSGHYLVYEKLGERKRNKLKTLKFYEEEQFNTFYSVATPIRRPELLKDVTILDRDFLNNGTQVKNFVVDLDGSDDGKGVDILYHSPLSDLFLKVGSVESSDEAVRRIRELSAFLRQLNMSSESMRIVEHTLLYPDPSLKRFGAEIRNSEGKVMLALNLEQDYPSVEALLNRIAETCMNAETPFMVTGVNGMYSFQYEEDGIAFAHHPQTYKEERQVHQAMAELCRIIKGIADNHATGNRSGYYFYVSQPGHTHVPVSFYSFRVSIVLPAVGARFNDTQFRKYAETVFRAELPAHIGMEVLWLSFESFREFEALYQQWRSGIARAASQHQEHPAADALAAFLHKAAQ